MTAHTVVELNEHRRLRRPWRARVSWSFDDDSYVGATQAERTFYAFSRDDAVAKAARYQARLRAKWARNDWVENP